MPICKPMGSMLLIVTEAPSDEINGLLKPEDVRDREQPTHGIVADKGPLSPDWINVGDLVVFAEWAGINISFEGARLCLLNPSEILGRVIDAPAA